MAVVNQNMRGGAPNQMEGAGSQNRMAKAWALIKAKTSAALDRVESAMGLTPRTATVVVAAVLTGCPTSRPVDSGGSGYDTDFRPDTDSHVDTGEVVILDVCNPTDEALKGMDRVTEYVTSLSVGGTYTSETGSTLTFTGLSAVDSSRVKLTLTQNGSSDTQELGGSKNCMPYWNVDGTTVPLTVTATYVSSESVTLTVLRLTGTESGVDPGSAPESVDSVCTFVSSSNNYAIAVSNLGVGTTAELTSVGTSVAVTQFNLASTGDSVRMAATQGTTVQEETLPNGGCMYNFGTALLTATVTKLDAPNGGAEVTMSYNLSQ